MKKILLCLLSVSLMLVLAFNVQAEIAAPGDTIAKVNFSWDNTWDVDGWTGIYGSSSFPVDLGDGVGITATGGNLAMGTSGEAASTVVPDKVSNTYNWMSNTDETPVDLIITGLDAAKEYDFIIFASRADETASGDRTTTYTVTGTTITGSVNPVGNTDQLVTLPKVTPASTGAVIIQLTKLAGNYGYINALIITEASNAVTHQLTVNTVGNGQVDIPSGTYNENASVTLTATPDAGWVFAGWSGDVTGTNVSVSVTMDADKTVTATFTEQQTAVDTVSKINFSWDNTWDVDGWIGVYGSSSFPVDLGNGLSLTATGGNLAMGTSGEETSTVVPDKVSNTYNWISNTDETPVDLIITGLDPASKYNFIIFASRADETASGDRTTTYTVTGTTITGSVNPVGNNDQLVKLLGVSPASTGAVIIQLTKQAGNYGYINALIITKASDVTSYSLNVTKVGNGNVDPSSGTYEDGASVTLTATPETGWEFSGWSGDATGSDASITVTMDAAKNITATFTEKQAAIAIDTVAKINFSWDNTWDVEGWTGVYGSDGFPVVLGNGITVTASGGGLAMGTSGEPTSTVVPDKVSNTYNWISNTDETPVDLIITGLDPAKTYAFVIYASRDGATSSGDRTTTYTVTGTSISGSVNPVGNTSQLVTLPGVVPASTGAVIIQITKLAGNYGYINALIIGEEKPTSSKMLENSLIKVYPNPVLNELTISNLTTNSRLSVYNITGKKIVEYNDVTDNLLKIGMSNLNSGVYFLRISNSTESEVKTFKIIKK